MNSNINILKVAALKLKKKCFIKFLSNKIVLVTGFVEVIKVLIDISLRFLFSLFLFLKQTKY